MSLDSEDISETDSADFQKVDNELSAALDSSVEDTDDIAFDLSFDDDDMSDSGDTVKAENGESNDLSDFEELDLNEGREMDLPIREKKTIA